MVELIRQKELFMKIALIGINAKLQTTINKYKENSLFICDPDKNTKCKKTN